MTKQLDIQMRYEGQGTVSLQNVSGPRAFYFFEKMRKAGKLHRVSSIFGGTRAAVRIADLEAFRALAEQDEIEIGRIGIDQGEG